MPPVRDRRLFLILALSYTLLIVYGSLYPLSGWRVPAAGWLPDSLLPTGVSGSDMVLNLLIYIPLGFLWSGYRRLGGAGALLPVLALAAGASLALELLQHFLPVRSTSSLDALLNVTGAALGAGAYSSYGSMGPGRWLQHQRRHWLRSDTPLTVAGLALLMWLFVELSPLLPDLSPGSIKQSLLPLYNGLLNPALLDLHATLMRLCLVLGFSLILLPSLRPQRPRLLLLTLLLAAVLAARVPVTGRQLPLDVVLGTLLAVGAVWLFRRREALWPWLGAGAVITGYVLAQTHVESYAASLHGFNWRPFSPQISHGFGLTDTVAQLWPFLALGLFLKLITRGGGSGLLLWSGSALIGGLAFALEWGQRALPGRQGDITDVILALLGWLLAWLLAAADTRAQPPRRARVAGQALYGFGILLVASLAATLLIRPVTGNAGQELRSPEIPAPASLPAVELPGVREQHPRLPHPSSDEISTIQTEGPRYLQLLQRIADNGRKAQMRGFNGVMAEMLQPGSQDLDRLHADLMKIEPTYRGHNQTKPLAMAYDWLYHKWTPQQRARLLEHTLHACDYQIGVIRRGQLSPYNVYLYNSPFQALMGCAIAVYGDHPRADAIMNFTHYYWKDVILPVWRRIMGENGGWHEGMEYVGVGVGDAVYQLPNMWRAATGEDLLASEPGLRGFADFIVQRKRPDDDDIHIGDGGQYHNQIPDAAALGVALDHPAAYSLDGCPDHRRPQPLSWPWGPLPDAGLCRPDAEKQELPLGYYADGIGLLIARSDWSPQATYVTFKAGDNYWSHTHLDQGSFTLFKGGPLAMDSGTYHDYGSDHHLNYSYQSVAHNLVTVTDPADTEPRRKGNGDILTFFNDGGQRRIGSGWGLAAPLTREHWQEQYEIYHTAETLAVQQNAGMAVKLADLTPAYTNRLSGKGTFAHRTRRVESLRRAFVYDRVHDAVIVFDRIEATRADFTKRWLLHTWSEPRVDKAGFSVEVPPVPERSGRDGGRLKGHVLLPERPRFERIGGPGKEFLLGDRNYDNDGGVYRQIEKRAERGRPLEPGAWRLEIMPPEPARLDHYLVVMLPALADRERGLEVRRLPDREDAFGVELRRGDRYSRWWFNKDGSRVEVVRYNKEDETEHHIIQ